MEEVGIINQKVHDQSRFIDPNRLTSLLTVVLYVDISLEIVSFIWTFLEFTREPIKAAMRASIPFSIPVILLLALISLAAIPSTIVLFLAWVYRAIKNFPSLNHPGVDYPGWTLAMFFIPILNLYWLFKVMNEIWQASDSEKPISALASRNNTTAPSVIIAWWGMWLAALFGPMIVEDNKLASSLVSHIATMAALVLSIYVTKTISEMQKDKYNKVHA